MSGVLSHHLATNVNHALQQLGLMLPPLRCQYTSGSQSWEAGKAPEVSADFFGSVSKPGQKKTGAFVVLTCTFIQYKQNIINIYIYI